MKLQGLTIIFIIIILPVIVVLTTYIDYEIDILNKQNTYNSAIISSTRDVIFSYEMGAKNNNYSNNPELKREELRKVVDTFEKSMVNKCNLGVFEKNEIEKYIPAMVFGMYDGFYMYAPYQTVDGYKHDLRNYVYYSETIKDKNNNDITIKYSLDNYIVVTYKNSEGRYETKSRIFGKY